MMSVLLIFSLIPSIILASNNDTRMHDANIFCSSRTPGAYSQGCGREVILCGSDGKSFSVLCPFSTWFDPVSLLCLPPSLISGCQDKVDSEKPTTLANLALSSQYCSGTRDGHFAASACSASVIYCSAGNANLFECPVGKAFDDLRGGCIPTAEIEDCKQPEKTRSTSASSESGEVDTQYSTNPFCVDGPVLNSDGCSPLYISCFEGVTKVLACPQNLLFDPELKTCNWQDDVKGCGAQAAMGDVCRESPDGLFSYGNCSSTFTKCSDGKQTPMFCPSTLVFDGERCVCDYPSAIPECQSAEAIVSVLTDGSEVSGSGEILDFSGSGEGSGIEASGESSGEASGADLEGSGSGAVLDLELTEDTQNDNKSSTSAEAAFESSRENDSLLTCVARGNGFFSTGCSSTLVACKNGKAKSLTCPEELVWDEELSICNLKENVTECTEVEVTTEASFPTTEKESSESEESREECNKEGTFSTDQCSPHYVLCVSGNAYPLRCEDGDLYSSADKRCIPAAGLADCFNEAL